MPDIKCRTKINLILNDGDTAALHLEHSQQSVSGCLNGHCVSVLIVLGLKEGSVVLVPDPVSLYRSATPVNHA